MTLAVVVRWAMAVAFVVAVLAARRSRALRPIAALLGYAVLADPVRRALAGHILAAQEGLRAAGIDPFGALTGWARVAGHVHQALWIGWGAALAATVTALLGLHRAWIGPAIAWAMTIAVLVAGYRTLGGYQAREVFLLCDLVTGAYAAGALASWAERRRSPEPCHIAAIALLLFHGAYLLAYHRGPWLTWDVARVALLGLFSVLTLLHLGVLCWPSKSRSAS